jgi:hypothetical protein
MGGALRRLLAPSQPCAAEVFPIAQSFGISNVLVTIAGVTLAALTVV